MNKKKYFILFLFFNLTFLQTNSISKNQILFYGGFVSGGIICSTLALFIHKKFVTEALKKNIKEMLDRKKRRNHEQRSLTRSFELRYTKDPNSKDLKQQIWMHTEDKSEQYL